MSQKGHRVEAGMGDGTMPFRPRWTGVEDSLRPVDSLVSSADREDSPPSDAAAASRSSRVTLDMPLGPASGVADLRSF